MWAINYLITNIKSFIFCIRYLPLSIAIKMPILVGFSFKIKKMKRGSILIETDKIHRNMISLGLGGTEGVVSNKGMLYIDEGAKLVFKGNAMISAGCSVRLDKNAECVIGNNLITMNKNSFLRCSTSIKIGNDVLIGWGVTINDNDGHNIVMDNRIKPKKGPIVIGNHVWIASHVTINKNSVIPDNSVVAQHSIVNCAFDKQNILLAGCPAKLVKESINWML